MKFRFLLTSLIALSVFIACNNESPTTSVQDSLSPAPVIPASDVKKLDTALYFAGLWVNEQYVNDVKHTRRPSNVEVPENACIIMPVKTLKETSLILGFHEGQEVVILKNGSRYEIWDKPVLNKLQDIELLSDTRLKLGFDTFVKLKSGDLSAEKNPYNIVDLLLFAGRYKDEHGATVEFSADGRVKGIPGINVYEAWLDYATSEAVTDQMSMGATGETMKDYAFRFDKNRLIISHMKCKTMGEDSICQEYAVGERYLTLTREN
ncbi:MAG: hypothetical protein ABW007_06620 [Chitinophagaceae bacterium]